MCIFIWMTQCKNVSKVGIETRAVREEVARCDGCDSVSYLNKG
jgi:hypothetical protein